MMRWNKVVTGGLALLSGVAATPAAEGAFEVVVMNPELQAGPALVFLGSLTALLFVVLVLLYGLRR